MINNETTVILLNGPPSVGKSRIIQRALVDELFAIDDSCQKRVWRESFAGPMKSYASAMLGTPYDAIHKNAPIDAFGGLNLREVLISESEQHMKPSYGKEIFGRLLVLRLINHPAPVRWAVIDDCGFPEEIAAIRGANISFRLVRVERPGFDFRGDSRSYLPNPDHILENYSTEEALVDQCITLAKILARRG